MVRPCYLKIKDSKGKETVREHWVWDIERFLSSQIAEHAKESASVVTISQEEYRAIAWKDRKI
jgi:hypothetical protein